MENETMTIENETMTMKQSLKEGGGIEMSTTVLPFAMLAPSLKYLPCKYFMASVSGSALKSPNKI